MNWKFVAPLASLVMAAWASAPSRAALAQNISIADTAVQKTDSLLRNGDFEGEFAPAGKAVSDKSQLGGQVAEGWKDDSGWGEVAITYSRDAQRSQSGQAAQRIEVHSIKAGGLQFVQDVPLKAGRIYRASAYLRTAAPAKARIEIRQAGAPYQIFGGESFQLVPEWRRYEVYARVTEDTNGFFLLGSSEAATYWIDGAVLEDVTDVTGKAGKPGNQLNNGSFETGLSNGWSGAVGGFDNNVAWAQSQHLDLRPKVDATTAANGVKSVVASLHPWTIFSLRSPLAPAAFGSLFTASVALKSERPQEVDVTLLIEGTQSEKKVQIGTEWTRYSVSGSMVTGTQARLVVRAVARDIKTPVKVWMDAAMLENTEAASPAYQATFPVELGLSVPRPGSIVFDSEVAPVDVQAAGANGKPLPAGARLEWSVENLAGVRSSRPLLPLPIKSLSVPADAKAPRGLFKVHTQVVDSNGKPLSAPVEQIFARLPRPRTLNAQQQLNSYFGVHIPLLPEYFKLARAVGANWLRVHDSAYSTQWPIVEPQPGQWNWTEAGIKSARDAGFQVLGMLDGAPRWASTNPSAPWGYFSGYNLPDAPGALEKWQEYVGKTVAHYKPWISHWEIWNEPYMNAPRDSFFPSGTPELYADLMRRASLAARQANPQVKLVGVCADGDDWINRVFKIAGPEHYDYMSFHYYGDRLQGGAGSEIAGTVARLRDTQDKYGQGKPIWNSEYNGGQLSWYRAGRSASEARQPMTHIVRFDVVQLTAGVQKMFLYSLGLTSPQGQDDLASVEHDRTIRPQLAARAVLANLIDGAKPLGRTEPKPGLDAYTFQHGKGQKIQVLWSQDGKEHSFPVPPRTRALDIQGNPLSGPSVKVTAEPLYLVAG